MSRPPKKGVFLWKGGRLGEKQMEVGDFKSKQPRKKYPQQWHEYNLSQTSEKIMFMDILDDLTRYIPLLDQKGRGRPRLSIQEMIYCMGLLIYGGKSSRRTISELQISKDKKIISHVPHFNSILNYFNEESLKKHLTNLLTLSSLPLKHFEQDFTVDSSGFTTSIFDRWVEHKWRGKKVDKTKVWIKCHAMSGVRTNIITAIEVTGAYGADSKMFPGLVNKTSENFRMKEVSADLAYSSRANLELVSVKGAIPYIPFKKNSTGKARGSNVWRTMFNYFQDHQEEYMEHYHKRSNAETVFSMIKRKLGMHLRTRKAPSQSNEILCKALCHNILVLIHEVFELGVSLEFENYIKCADSSFAQKLTP